MVGAVVESNSVVVFSVVLVVPSGLVVVTVVDETRVVVSAVVLSSVVTEVVVLTPSVVTSVVVDVLLMSFQLVRLMKSQILMLLKLVLW